MTRAKWLQFTSSGDLETWRLGKKHKRIVWQGEVDDSRMKPRRRIQNITWVDCQPYTLMVAGGNLIHSIWDSHWQLYEEVVFEEVVIWQIYCGRISGLPIVLYTKDVSLCLWGPQLIRFLLTDSSNGLMYVCVWGLSFYRSGTSTMPIEIMF